MKRKREHRTTRVDVRFIEGDDQKITIFGPHRDGPRVRVELLIDEPWLLRQLQGALSKVAEGKRAAAKAQLERVADALKKIPVPE